MSIIFVNGTAAAFYSTIVRLLGVTTPSSRVPRVVWSRTINGIGKTTVVKPTFVRPFFIKLQTRPHIISTLKLSIRASMKTDSVQKASRGAQLTPVFIDSEDEYTVIFALAAMHRSCKNK